MSKKKLLSFVLCFAIIFACLLVNEDLPTAISGASGVYESEEPVTPPETDFTYRKTPVNNPKKIIITKYLGKETKVIIPETIEGLPVFSITADAFYKNEKLTYVKLPSTLSGFSGKAFNLCSSLTEIDIDADADAFCVIDGILYRKDIDEDSATYGKPISLVCFPAGKGGHFTIPYGIEAVGAYAFDHCYNLTSVDMYNTVTSINSNAFSYCWNLESIRLSDNLKTLGQEALAHCDSLTKIDLPSKLNSIGTDAVLGTIDSDDNKVYFFVDGISCTKDSYAHEYLIDQALPKSIIILNNPSVTDNDTGIQLIDAYKTFPTDEIIDITVNEVALSEVENLLPIRYSSAYVFDIGFTKDGKQYIPEGIFVLNFDAACPDAIPSATKVYHQIGDELVLVSGTAHIPFVGAQSTKGGRFIILVNDDFSLKGDIDGDGLVTLFDVKASLYASTNTLTLTPEQKLAANVDNSQDGKITTKDARKILRLAGGMNAE